MYEGMLEVGKKYKHISRDFEVLLADEVTSENCKELFNFVVLTPTKVDRFLYGLNYDENLVINIKDFRLLFKPMDDEEII